MELGISEYKKQLIRINKLALPILMTFATNFLFTLGDQAIVGRTSMAEFAAVTVVANNLYALTGSLGILSLALNIIGSKLIGQGNQEAYKELFSTAFTLTLIIAIAFESIALLFGRQFLKIAFKMSGYYLSHAYTYLAIASLGVGFNMMLFMFSAYFKTVERTEILFKSSIISSFINLAIDYTLVFGKFGFPRLGVMGAAIGTVIGLAVNTWLYYRFFGKISAFKLSLTYSRDTFRKLLASYLPLLGQDMLESSLISMGLISIIATLGKELVATYNLAATLMQMLLLPIYAYSSALMTVTAKAHGANELKTITRSKQSTEGILLIILLSLGSLLLLFSKQFASLITNQAALINSVSNFIAIAFIMQVTNLFHQTRLYILNALGEEKWIMNFSIITGFITLGLVYLFIIHFSLGLSGAYLGLMLAHVIYSIGFGWKIKSYATLETKEHSI